jgi:hypothetical protein
MQEGNTFRLRGATHTIVKVWDDGTVSARVGRGRGKVVTLTAEELAAVKSGSMADALASADRLISEHGLCLSLVGPEGGYWYADLHVPGGDANLGEGYIRARDRTEALRLAVERAERVLGACEP